MQIDVTVWNGPETESENEFRPLDERIDEFHPKATRTLFIGNLEKTTTYHDLLNIFQRFGEIVDIDIKKVNGAPQYAFLQYCDIASVCKAIKKMDAEYLGNNRLKLGFGKSMPTTCVWLDGLALNTTEQFLTRHFCRYGHVVKVVFDRMKGMALILYNNIEYAQAAVKDTKGWKIGGSKIKVDFANQESQIAFYRSMQASGQDIRDFYDVLSERRDERRSQYEFQAERQYYENVRTPGTYTEDQRRKYTARTREFYTEWDPYQGDYYDPQYFDEQREYREYRADPYEQDIRKYSYLQRERERERERFETDRGRDHGRRTIERSQSPAHIATRRPASPSASPSLTERIPGDPDRRICCRSSERSGSCSPISPPRFEKLEKGRSERFSKIEKLEKDRIFEIDRINLFDKDKKTGRKDRGDKDKSEKQRLKKMKISSPIIQTCETEPEPEREGSPESVPKSKSCKILKENSSSRKLDLLPCVVQLTRVREKEGKLIAHACQDTQLLRSVSPRLASPTNDQRSPPFCTDLAKIETLKHAKVPRDKNMLNLVEISEKEGKTKSKKHWKSEMAFDSGISVDIERLAARKRRFEDSGKIDRHKRNSEDDFSRSDLYLEKNLTMHKKEQNKEKSFRMYSASSPNDGRECESSSGGLPLEQHSQLRGALENVTDQLGPTYEQQQFESSKMENSSSVRKMTDNSSLYLDEINIQHRQVLPENEIGKCLDSDDGVENYELVEPTNISLKQIEHSRWHPANFSDSGIVDKFKNPLNSGNHESETSFVTYEDRKSIHDLANDEVPCKRNKPTNFDFDTFKEKRECKFSQRLNEDLYTVPSTLRGGQLLENEDDAAQISLPVSNKIRKSSPTTDDKLLHSNSLKNSSSLTVRQLQSSDNSLRSSLQLPKLKASFLQCNDELLQHWGRRIKTDSQKMEMTFQSDISKRECIRKGQDLEPGEVQSDSDDDGGNRHITPKSSRQLSYILSDREERMIDLKLSGSLEKNKFYSFALDKTITPDTKALLERAKTLYSTREDNWSFLPSCFPSSHSCSDKDKVKLAPRPIPSWYMKKKKIRTDSDEKLHDKKEELKPLDQERQELFASRFLHSSIFEQDSRRLQHLERKDQDLETGGSKTNKPTCTEAKPQFAVGNIPQEPIVLFHSRFLELQQQKDKDHLTPDTETDSTEEIREGKAQSSENRITEMEEESLLKSDNKSAISPITLISSPVKVTEMSPISPSDVKDFSTPFSDPPVPLVKEEKVEIVHEGTTSDTLPVEDCKPVTPRPTTSPLPENVVETPIELVETKDKNANTLKVEGIPVAEETPSTPGGSMASYETETKDLSYADPSKPAKKSETTKTEPEDENQGIQVFEESQKNDTDNEPCMPELDAVKPLPNRRQPKSKKAKALKGLQASQPTRKTLSRKPATRKSERIDKEKLKRTLSPRTEAPKICLETKATSKSPNNASDFEPGLESTLIHGRTRRRNVRSVYATLHEEDQLTKDVVESSRCMRKRGADKEPIQQDVQTSTIARRGRPPKRGLKRIEEVLPAKVDQKKIFEADTEIKEALSNAEVVKPSEAWRSPRTQKLQQSPLPSSNPPNKKGSRTDQLSSSAAPLNVQAEMTSHDEAEIKLKSDSDMFCMLTENLQNASSIVQEKDANDSVEKKPSDADIEKKNLNYVEMKQQHNKSRKPKPLRLKRNAKPVTEEKSHSLKNLEIRVSVDDVKVLLRSEADEPETFQTATITKNKTVVQDNEASKITSIPKEPKDICAQEKDDIASEPDLPIDPAFALLARQMELEQAVENIAKLTVEQSSRLYKEPPSEQPPVLPPVVAAPVSVVEEEKRAHPASETELAAAIDSITAEETSGDVERFTTTSTYTALARTPDSLISSSSNEMMEPETHMVINNILAEDIDGGPLSLSPKRLMFESKKVEDPIMPETPKRVGKVRGKTPKKSRSRKGAVNRKGNSTEEVSQSEPSLVKLPDSIPEDPETVDSKVVTVTVGVSAATSVVTAVATCRRDVTSVITVDTPKEAEQPEVEQPEPKESAFHSGTSNNSSSKKHPFSAELRTPSFAPAVACPSRTTSQFTSPLLRPSKVPHSPDMPKRSEEPRIYVTPSCHVTVVTPTAPASISIGTPSTNPPMPPDTKASDIDPSSSTLRKILMEPKYVSASNSNSIPTTIVTSVLSDSLRMSEKEKSCDTGSMKSLQMEGRPSLLPQPVHHKPSPLTEFQQNCSEKTQHTVISPATSVISRIPMPYDTEEAPRISLSNRSMGLNISKQKYRSNSNENSWSQGMNVSEDGPRGRCAVETTPYNAGFAPGLRVNTSQGVVVLSYSGQKTEGPHRMRAKISQIPQASAGDIEFQQSVSKSQTKQEPLITSSLSPTPKVALTSATFGPTGVLLPNQSYNSQPVISCNKPESFGYDKSDAPYHTAPQGGVVKMFQPPVSSPQVLMYNPAVIQQQHGKRGADHMQTKTDVTKAIQQSNLSPVISSHLSSLSGTRLSPSPGMANERSVLHHKQEPQSPRTPAHSPSPYVKPGHPTTSPIATSVVLSHGMPPISTYHSDMHHPHSEKSSVIMKPHSLSQSMANEARMNPSPMSGLNYSRRGDSLTSPLPGPQQCSSNPPSNVIRDLVLHSNPQSTVSSSSDDEPRSFTQGHTRASVPQLQSDLMMIHSDHRGIHPSVRMDQYRDMHQRVLMHQRLGEQTLVEARQPPSSETGTSSSNLTGPSKNLVLGKNFEVSGREILKPGDGKLTHSANNESRIRSVSASSPVMLSPHPHGVPLMHPGGAGSFSVYRDVRGFSSQLSGHNLASQGISSSQIHPEAELGTRGKISKSHGGGSDSKLETSHLSHISRISGDTVASSYQSPLMSPMGLAHKQDLSVLQKGPPTFLPSPQPVVHSPSSLQHRPEAKLETSGHRSIDTVQLLTKYPIVWQGLLALKNDQAAVQLHFVSGNNLLAQHSLPPPEGTSLLRIVQRMRLEATQLDSVARRMTVENDYCLLLALPCGRDQDDVLGQTQALKSGFITYLQAKQAAGIINVPNPGSNQPAYVVQIFPPCEFSEGHLSRLAPDLLNSISSISPHLMIVIASV
ncbi:msx2-interacting protein isoform X2 [Gouania willdenowi]|nr:msx2-interacting protein isoform X2 [Gouania willdenowi]